MISLNCSDLYLNAVSQNMRFKTYNTDYFYARIVKSFIQEAEL